MIAKHINHREIATSNIVRLVEYITSDQDKAHRVGEVMIVNCRQDDPEHAAHEMLVTQARNRRAKSDKTYHLLVSFRPGEEPTPETIRRVEKEVCARLGYGEHQRIAVVHHDTDNTHIHIAINKIHPARFVIHDPPFDYRTLAKACGDLEKSFHLHADNHAPTGKTPGERKAGDMEAMTGQESLLSWIKRECLPAMKTADTWDALHAELAKAGLALALRGNGMVIADAAGAAVKASDVDRAFSKGNLEKRLGAFHARAGVEKSTQVKTYQKEPLGPANPLKAEFEKKHAAREAARAGRFVEIREDYWRGTAAVRVESRVERLRAKRIPAGRMVKKRLYRALADACRQRLRSLREKAARERKTVIRESPRQTWLSWLQAEAKAGREEAVAILRGRALGLARKHGAAIRGERPVPAKPLDGPAVDVVTKRGAIIYNIGKDALRDDGESFRISRDSGLETAILALKAAKQRFGACIRLEGDHAFRERMVQAAVAGKVTVRFSDPALEEKRESLFRQTHKSVKHLQKEYERP